MSENKTTAFSFNAEEVEPQQPLEPVPAGFYNAILEEISIGETNAGGERIAFTGEIINGDYAGRKFFDGFNVVNSNEQAQNIARAQLSALCRAVGQINIEDLTQLLNKPFTVKLSYQAGRENKETGESYEPRNQVKGFKAIEGDATPTLPAGGKAAPKAAKEAASPKPAPGWQKKTAASSDAAPASSNAPASTVAAAKGKPAGPAKPGAPAKPKEEPKAERFFFAYYEDDSHKHSEAELAQMFADGLPEDTPVALITDADDNCEPWGSKDVYNIEAPAKEEAPAKPAAPAKPSTPAKPATAGATGKAPWKKK